MDIQEKLNMMINDLTPIYMKDGDKPLFLAIEVAKKWGHTNIKQALDRSVSDNEKLLINRVKNPDVYTYVVNTYGLSKKIQSFWLLSEPAVYMLALRSNNQKSKDFISSVANKIVAIRETEGFSVSEFVDVMSGAYTIKNSSKTYLMVDNSNGYVKIGKSINPKKRERTLLSEKPTIKLLFVCENNVESELHQKYASKRIRGEWYKISLDEVASIVKKYRFVKID
jgi:prophage antirepressor-like protein